MSKADGWKQTLLWFGYCFCLSISFFGRHCISGSLTGSKHKDGCTWQNNRHLETEVSSKKRQDANFDFQPTSVWPAILKLCAHYTTGKMSIGYWGKLQNTWLWFLTYHRIHIIMPSIWCKFTQSKHIWKVVLIYKPSQNVCTRTQGSLVVDLRELNDYKYPHPTPTSLQLFYTFVDSIKLCLSYLRLSKSKDLECRSEYL